MARCLRLRFQGASISKPDFVGSGVECRRGVWQGHSGSISLGSSGRIEAGVIVHAYGGSIELGRRVFIGPYAVLYGHGGLTIGDDSLISMHCRLISSEHSIPVPGKSIRSEPDVRKATHIGKDVWLGAGVTVLGGVSVGDGCVVGAGSVVRDDLPPFSVAVGVPARVIRKR